MITPEFQKLIDFYEMPLMERLKQRFINGLGKEVPTEDDYDMWMDAFDAQYKNNSGHQNFQHSFPDFLLKKLWKQENYHLNREVYPDKSLLTYETHHYKEKDAYDLLYSEWAVWSAYLEGWMNRIESLFAQILVYKKIATSEDLLNHILDEDEGLVKVGFFFVLYMSLLRSTTSQKHLRSASTGDLIGIEERFLDKENWDDLVLMVLMLRTMKLKHYRSDLGIAFNKDLIKLIPQDIKNIDMWDARGILRNTCLMFPLSSKDIIVVLPTDINNKIYSDITEYFGCHIDFNVNDFVFNMYNNLSIFMNSETDRVFTSNKAKLLLGKEQL